MFALLFNKYQVNMRVESEGQMPMFAGSTLRGALFYSLRALVCLTKKEKCKDCIVWDSCVYSYFFETPLRQQQLAMNPGESAPHPFILEPPFPPQRFFQIGDTFTFNLILVGKAISFLPHMICAIDEMAHRGIARDRIRFALEQILVETENGHEEIYSDKKLKEHRIIYRSEDLLKKSLSVDSIKLHCITPVRIKYHGSLCSKLTFDIFARNLLRRLSLISSLHGYDYESIDISPLLERAKTISKTADTTYWFETTRYSSRQETTMQFGGILGELTFEGEFKEIFPLIKLGEFLHIGKNTSFGLGKYRISDCISP